MSRVARRPVSAVAPARCVVAGVAAGVAVLLLAGCGADIPPPSAAPEPTPPPLTVGPGSTTGAMAEVVLLVPQDAARLQVVDWEQAADQVGVPWGTGVDDPGQEGLAPWWQRALDETAALEPGVLAGVDEAWERRFGFGEADVRWQATWSYADSSPPGWAVALGPDVDLDAVRGAIAVAKGPLAGGQLDEETRVVASGAASDVEQSWAVDRALVPLLGVRGVSTVADRACTDPASIADLIAQVQEAQPTLERAAPLPAWSLVLQGGLATVRLGANRSDLPLRRELAAADPAFATAFVDPTIDPSGGRIGWVLRDPAAAAAVVRAGDLPVTVCG